MLQQLQPGILGDYTEVWIEVIFRMSFRTRNGKLVRSHNGRPFQIKIRFNITLMQSSLSVQSKLHISQDINTRNPTQANRYETCNLQTF